MRKADALARLKPFEHRLRERGINALYLFGSTARDEAAEDSDLDLLYEYDRSRPFSLFDQAGAMLELSDSLGTKVDLISRLGLRPRVRARVEGEMIRVFLMANVQDTLDDLAILIARAEQSVKGRRFEDLTSNDEAYDALTYRLAMIGETCKKLPDAIKARHPHLPWREMATFRNFASHDYFGIDARLVWQAAMGLEPVKAMMIEETARLQEK
jgi:uncharacterized protein